MSLPATRTTRYAAWLTLAIIAGTAAYLIDRYPRLTPFLPVHFGRGGMGDRWRPKSWSLVLMPLWVQVALAAMLGAIVLALLWHARHGAQPDAAERAPGGGGAPPVRPGGGGAPPVREDDAARMIGAAEAVALLALVWIGFQAFAAWELMDLWRRLWGGLRFRYEVGVLIAVVLSVVIGIRAVAMAGAGATPTTDPALWRWRVLYYNPADPALFVPARHGFGYTLNFGRRVAVVLLALALLIGAGAPLAIVSLLIR